MGGSSPRAWGTLVFDFEASSERRFIPTCVGNIARILLSSTIMTVHPHVRGEHPTSWVASDVNNGSSPRAWGTSARGVFFGYCVRFIPTCVGNMRRRSWVLARLPVHPHVRGEHSYSCRKRRFEDGSSPRAWGTCAATESFTGIRRFIPTCVGNIITMPTQRINKTVHPHVRGEHKTYGFIWLKDNGSSPRAWGT